MAKDIARMTKTELGNLIAKEAKKLPKEELVTLAQGLKSGSINLTNVALSLHPTQEPATPAGAGAPAGSSTAGAAAGVPVNKSGSQSGGY